MNYSEPPKSQSKANASSITIIVMNSIVSYKNVLKTRGDPPRGAFTRGRACGRESKLPNCTKDEKKNQCKPLKRHQCSGLSHCVLSYSDRAITSKNIPHARIICRMLTQDQEKKEER